MSRVAARATPGLLAALALAALPAPARADDENVRVLTTTPVRPDAPEAPPAPPTAPAPAAPAAQPAPEAATADPAAEPPAAPPDRPSERRVHAGLLVTPLSLTRPIAVELFVRGPPIGAGFGYSSFPSLLSSTLLALAGANKGATTVSLDRYDAWTGEARLFPFLGAFHLGAAVGRQHLAGTLTRQTEVGPESVHVDLVSWFLSPRIGWLWRADSGFTLGAAIGLQLTLSSEQQVTVPPEATDTLRKNLDSLVHFAAGLPLPELLLRAGYLF